MARSSVQEDYLEDGKLRAAEEQDIATEFARSQVEENGATRAFLCRSSGKIADATLRKKTIEPTLRLSRKSGTKYCKC
jgi:hypothetical protein